MSNFIRLLRSLTPTQMFAAALTIAGAFGVTVQQVYGLLSGLPQSTFVAVAWLLVAIGIGGMLWPVVKQHRAKSRSRPKKARQIKAPPNRRYLWFWQQHQNRACRRVENELGAACQESREHVDHFSDWKAQNADFIEAVLGKVARARFDESDEPEQARQVLLELAGDLSPEKVRLMGTELEQAIEARTQIEKQ